jgi:hypothetical protein
MLPANVLLSRSFFRDWQKKSAWQEKIQFSINVIMLRCCRVFSAERVLFPTLAANAVGAGSRRDQVSIAPRTLLANRVWELMVSQQVQ